MSGADMSRSKLPYHTPFGWASERPSAILGHSGGAVKGAAFRRWSGQFQRIVPQRVVDRSATSGTALEQGEMLDRDWPGAEQAALLHEAADPFLRGVVQPGKRHVGGIAPLLGRQPGSDQGRLDLLVQVGQRVVALHPGPQDA